jgi:hypothetical protein
LVLPLKLERSYGGQCIAFREDSRTIRTERSTGDAAAGVKSESATPSFCLFVTALLLPGFLRAKLNKAAVGPKQKDDTEPSRLGSPSLKCLATHARRDRGVQLRHPALSAVVSWGCRPERTAVA